MRRQKGRTSKENPVELVLISEAAYVSIVA